MWPCNCVVIRPVTVIYPSPCAYSLAITSLRWCPNLYALWASIIWPCNLLQIVSVERGCGSYNSWCTNGCIIQFYPSINTWMPHSIYIHTCLECCSWSYCYMAMGVNHSPYDLDARVCSAQRVESRLCRSPYDVTLDIMRQYFLEHLFSSDVQRSRLT